MIRTKLSQIISFAMCIALAAAVPAYSAPSDRPDEGRERPPIRMENLDRGLVAAATPQGVFVSWRLLGNEATGHGENGVTGTDFALYRGETKIASVTDSTNFLDPAGSTKDVYRVVPLVKGRERGHGETADPWDQNYVDLPLQRPPDGVTPAGESYTYAGAPSGRRALSGANDTSVGDVDGDGELEFVVKWEPSNSKDVSQVGYTGPVFLDTYELDGTLRHRISLGPNIRAGAHYTQFLVYDFDGDGRAEIMLKTAPGTSSTSYKDNKPSTTEYITIPNSDRAAGVSHDDDYRLSTDGYYEQVVDMFRGWSSHPEVVAGSWPSTLEEAFGIEPKYDYPLSDADARALADYFMDVYAPSKSSKNALRDFEGFILSGPEYLTVFDGSSGTELQTVPYEPGRTDDGLMWGDYAGSRIEPGNRVDRFLSGVAYLDGRTPSAVFSRGYYNRAAVAAYDWDGERLTQEWMADSGWERRTNPFGGDWTAPSDPEWGPLAGQGFHSLSAADVDADGKQEIVYGSATLDHDGSLLYSSEHAMPAESERPGEIRSLGHGDAMHVADIDPARTGLEIFTAHENTQAPYGMVLRRAEDGTALFGEFAGSDVERAMVGDVDPTSPGLEVWASVPGAEGLHAASGETLSESSPGANMSIRWSAEMTTQMITGEVTDTVDTPTIEDREEGTLLTATGTLTNNHTKGTPALVGDLFGDWREELVLRTADSSSLRIYLSTEVTDHKMYTLLHDMQYRPELARQQTGYNQPTYTSFYFGSDTDWADVPLPRLRAPRP